MENKAYSKVTICSYKPASQNLFWHLKILNVKTRVNISDDQ